MKDLSATSTVPVSATRLDDEYSHPLAREHFDWCETVEESISIKTESHDKSSAAPISATNRDENYEGLLVQEPFDWWEDVENDNAMKGKALDMDTEDVGTTSTCPATSTKLVLI
ncbi:hypothetical protein N7491_009080 [Penicillium cf. griseofulvum]|nr:hypothetical protein N7491_009080 [Penicillium cf. griseofulvum]KAJ5430883.1 hypothetical protein N7445_008615 [Penicillium cf. griseofulvum]